MCVVFTLGLGIPLISWINLIWIHKVPIWFNLIQSHFYDSIPGHSNEDEFESDELIILTQFIRQTAFVINKLLLQMSISVIRNHSRSAFCFYCWFQIHLVQQNTLHLKSDGQQQCTPQASTMGNIIHKQTDVSQAPVATVQRHAGTLRGMISSVSATFLCATKKPQKTDHWHLKLILLKWNVF